MGCGQNALVRDLSWFVTIFFGGEEEMKGINRTRTPWDLGKMPTKQEASKQ